MFTNLNPRVSLCVLPAGLCGEGSVSESVCEEGRRSGSALPHEGFGIS